MKPLLFNEIQKYADRAAVRFHMPGHSGEKTDALYASAPYDITELPFSDNLQNPTGIIKEAEERAATAYGGRHALYLTQGATAALFCAIGASAGRGDKVLVERACHKSVYSAVRFFGLNAEYVYPDFDENGIPLALTARKAEEAIDRHPDAVAFIFNACNYFGRAADAQAAEAAKAAGMTVIADQAHGAHYPFYDNLPDGFSETADFCAVSLHKTLDVYTGGALLIVNNEGLYDKTCSLRADLHTTSPSYLVMASMDKAVCDMYNEGRKTYAEIEKTVKEFKKNSNIVFAENDDFTRLVTLGLDKNKLAAANIEKEAQWGDADVFILTPSNYKKTELLKNCAGGQFRSGRRPYLPLPVKGVAGDRYEFVDLEKAEGRTAYKEAGIYPPGIPAVAYGEKITADILKLFSENEVFGLVNGKICVIIDK